MNFARKLKEVVASNFIEIAKTDEEATTPNGRPTPEIDRTAAPRYMDAPPPATYTAPAVSEVVKEEPRAETVTSATVEAYVAPEIEAPTVAEEVVTEPEPVIEVPSVVAPVAVAPSAPYVRRNLLESVAPHDPVNLDDVIKSAQLPPVPFSAEQAAKVLSALPVELPLQVKRLTVKATMEAVERGRAIEPQEIVADAMLKKAHLTNYRDEFRTTVEAFQRETDTEIIEIKVEIEREIARLKAEVDRLEALKLAASRKQRAVEQVTGERVTQLEQVVVFFQSEVARDLDQKATTRTTDDDDEELPPFMRDDAVFRMLGLENSNSDSDDHNGADEAAVGGKRPRAKGRKFAVAENVES